MTDDPQIYQKHSLQYFTTVCVDKGVILQFSKWGFTQATATCWNDSSDSGTLLSLCYYCAKRQTCEAGLFSSHSHSARAQRAQYTATTTVLHMLKEKHKN